MTAFPKYPAYKDSGVAWIGDVPEHWGVYPNRRLFEERKVAVGKKAHEYKLLSLTLNGVIPRDMENPKGKFPAEFNTYSEVEPNDLVFCLFDLDETPRTVGIAPCEGMITGAYTIFKPKQEVNPKYQFYYYLSLDEQKALKPLYTGLRKTISRSTFASAKSPCPPRAEQDRIVAFLDEKTAEIDRLIAKKQRQIELLDEQKAILINRAVTRGLHPQAELQDSGIDWLGPIPRHWEIKKIKHLATVFRGKFTHRPRNDPRLYDGPFPFIQTGDVAGAEREITSYSQTLNTRGLRVSTLVPAETVALTIAANVGDVAILGFDACFPDSVVGFMPHQTVSKLYLYYVLRGLKSHFLGLAPKNTQHNLNVERVGGQPIPCPPIKEQEEITSYIESIMGAFTATMRGFESQIQTLQTLRSTLIAHAVTGKIAIPAATA